VAVVSVVPALDELEDREAGVDLNLEEDAVEDLAFEGAKKLSQSALTRTRSTCAALIGVVDHVRRAALRERHAEGVEDDLVAAGASPRFPSSRAASSRARADAGRVDRV
jgi:hypothetical protein